MSSSRPCHRLRVLDPSSFASPILRLLFDPNTHLLAVLRSDKLELWTVTQDVFHATKQIYHIGQESSIECLVFCAKDSTPLLFSAGLQGLVLRHDLLSVDLETAVPHATALNGPVYSMVVSPVSNDVVAAGTELGRVFLLKINEQLRFDVLRILHKQQGPVLTLQWHPSAAAIATGSTDMVHVIGVERDELVSQFTLARSERKKETVVWALLFMEDWTIVTGDSRGRTSFWDGKKGTLYDEYSSHSADVLCLSHNKQQRIVYSSGIDPLLVQFQTVRLQNRPPRWVRSIHRRVHTHDVASMATLSVEDKQYLVSGGNSNALVVDDIRKRTIVHYQPMPSGEDFAAVANEAKVVMLRLPRSIQLWRLQVASNVLKDATKDYKHFVRPEKLLDLKTLDDEIILTSAISSKSDLIVYATPTRFRAFGCSHIESDSMKKAKLSKLKVSNNAIISGIRHVCILEPSTVATITAEGRVQILRLDENKTDLKLFKKFDVNEDNRAFRSDITNLVVDETHLLVAHLTGLIEIFDWNKECRITSLPTYAEARIVALTLNNDSVYVVYSDHNIREYSIQSGSNTDFSSKLAQLDCRQWKAHRLRSSVRGIVVVDNKLVLYDDKTIYSVDKESSASVPKASKRATSKESGIVVNAIKDRFEDLLAVSKMNNELVVLEATTQMYNAALPPALHKRRFGAM